jgi:predicted Rossmann fold nucleotide-binding protein DprA/Smf involved in DNA uptake
MHGFPRLFALGDLGILERATLGLLCSVRCPGDLALRAVDLSAAAAARGPVVVSGFHSPVESACLPVLARSGRGVVWCLARHQDPASLDPECLAAVSSGRLLVLSPFGRDARGSSVARARLRNRLVASLADVLLAVHAEPGGEVERCCREALARGGLVLTFGAPANANLLALGVRALEESGKVLPGAATGT